MLRHLALAGLLAGLAGEAAAQDVGDWQVLRKKPRYAGTYHVASRTWTRPGQPRTEALNHIVYDNTMLWTGAAPNTVQWRGTNCCIEVYDDGRLPGPRLGPPGAQDDYRMQEVTFGYVTFAPPGTVDITLEFFDSLGGACAGFTPPNPPPPPAAGTLLLNAANGVSLPGDPTPFQGTAWFVTIDLSDGGEFCMLSEGDGTPGNGDDNFNWSFRHNNPAATTGGMRGGPIIAGEPLRGAFGACTFNLACGTDPIVGPGGTGLGTTDAFWVNVDGDPPGPAGSINTSLTCQTSLTGTGCFSFGGWPGNPYASFFLRLRADGSCAPPPPVVPYCSGKTASNGCIPFLTSDSGTASASSPSAWNVRSNDHVPDELGFLVYGFKKSNLNFHGGKLCVKAPLVRTSVAKVKNVSCVNPFGSCDSPDCRQLRRNFNATVQSGVDPLLTPGQPVVAQMIQRDPTEPQGFGDNLSDALYFVIAP